MGSSAFEELSWGVFTDRAFDEAQSGSAERCGSEAGPKAPPSRHPYLKPGSRIGRTCGDSSSRDRRRGRAYSNDALHALAASIARPPNVGSRLRRSGCRAHGKYSVTDGAPAGRNGDALADPNVENSQRARGG